MKRFLFTFVVCNALCFSGVSVSTMLVRRITQTKTVLNLPRYNEQCKRAFSRNLFSGRYAGDAATGVAMGACGTVAGAFGGVALGEIFSSSLADGVVKKTMPAGAAVSCGLACGFGLAREYGGKRGVVAWGCVLSLYGGLLAKQHFLDKKIKKSE